MKLLFFKTIILVSISTLLTGSCKKETIPIAYTPIVSGVSSTIYKIKSVTPDTLYLCGGTDSSGFILLSTDAGKTWKNFENGFWERILDLDFANDSIVIATSKDINFFKSSDKGITWKLVTPVAGQYPLSAYKANMYSIDMVNDTIGFACGGEYFQQGFIYRTIDGGNSWQLTNKNHEMRSVLMADANNGFACGYGVIYRTADSGITWNLTDGDNEFYTGLCSADKKNVFAAGFNGGIKQGNFGSDAWNKKLKSNGVGERIHFNCIDFFDNNIGVAAGTDGVIYISRDGGTNWTAGSAFDNALINTVLLLSNTEGLAAGNDGKLFRFTF